jgi:hypothetical protein
MKAVSIVKARDFKPENVKFSKPRVTQNGRKIVYINYDYEDGGSPQTLRIQLPRMKAPFGVSGLDTTRKDVNDNSTSDSSTDYLELSFNEEDASILEKFDKLDELAKKVGAENFVFFFKKKYSETLCDTSYRSSIKYSVDKETGEPDARYPPRLKTKLNKTAEGNYTCTVYSPDKSIINMDYTNWSAVVPKGSECISIIECYGIYVLGDKFGLSWSTVQMKVYKNTTRLVGYSFIDDEEDEERENRRVQVSEELLEDLSNLAFTDEAVEDLGETERDLLDEVREPEATTSRRRRKAESTRT